MTRGTLSKRIRFSVFKRDSFTCRYCGATAPNVELHIDHVIPVADGGSDEFDNLVTACAACNFGKGAKGLAEDELSALRENGPAYDAGPHGQSGSTGLRDSGAPVSLENDGETVDAGGFANRHEQAQAIEERRAQLEMMIEWREEIAGLQDEAVDALDRRIVERTGISMSQECRQRMRRWVRQYGVPTIFEAMEDALDQMLEWRDGVVLLSSWERAFAAIPQIVELRQAARDKPHFRELTYICGLLRRRLPYVNELRCLRLMEDGVGAGASIEAMKAFARTVKNWTAFRKGLEEFIDDYGRAGPAITGGAGKAVDSGNPLVGSQTESGEYRTPTVSDADPDPSPFDKRRPLRHFSPDGRGDEPGRGDRQVAETGGRHRPS